MGQQTIAGTVVEITEDGFFTDPEQRREEMAPELAKAEHIDDLTEDHWQVLKFMRHEYLANGTGPTVRIWSSGRSVEVRRVAALPARW